MKGVCRKSAHKCISEQHCKTDIFINTCNQKQKRILFMCFHYIFNYITGVTKGLISAAFNIYQTFILMFIKLIVNQPYAWFKILILNEI